MSDYSDYKLTGSVLSDRDTVNRAINDPNLSSSEKNDIILEHNLHNLDSVSYVPDTTQHDSGGDPEQKTINSLNSAKLVIEKRYDELKKPFRDQLTAINESYRDVIARRGRIHHYYHSFAAATALAVLALLFSMFAPKEWIDFFSFLPKNVFLMKWYATLGVVFVSSYVVLKLFNVLIVLIKHICLWNTSDKGEYKAYLSQKSSIEKKLYETEKLERGELAPIKKELDAIEKARRELAAEAKRISKEDNCACFGSGGCY